MRDYLAVVARPKGAYQSFMSKHLVWRTDPESPEICSEAAPDLANPDRADDGRLMYYEHQVQRSDFYDGGRLDQLPIAEVRDLFKELLFFTGICTGFEFPLPPAGLPGHLNEKYDPSEPAAALLELGVEYIGAIVFNERRTMHNRWREARAFIDKIEREAVRKYQDEQARQWSRQTEGLAASQQVYFIGAASGPIKIGIAAHPLSRLSGLQTGHHEKLELLATCAGGQPQERDYHKRFADHRLSGEWFERCPEIEAEIERLRA